MDANTTAAAPYVEPQRFQMEPADKDTARRVKAEFNRIAEKTGSMPPFVSLDGTTYYRSPGVAKMTRTTVLDNSTTTNTVTDTSAPSGTDTKAAIPIIR